MNNVFQIKKCQKSMLMWLCVLTVIVFSVSSCATVFGCRRSYPIIINSSPMGATVKITDKKGNEVYQGQTPVDLKLKSGKAFAKGDYQVTLDLIGYEKKIIPIQAKPKIPAIVFNILLSNGLGCIIDAGVGSMWKIDDYSKCINVTLNSLNRP